MKLTNQFTSPEQSVRLLSAGLPEWTADSYYSRLGGPGHSWTGPILLTFSGYRVSDVRKSEKDYARERNTDPDEVLACWSTGRLIEIWLRCINPEWHDGLPLIESDAEDQPAYMTDTFIHGIAGGELDFKQLEG